MNTNRMAHHIDEVYRLISYELIRYIDSATTGIFSDGFQATKLIDYGCRFCGQKDRQCVDQVSM